MNQALKDKLQAIVEQVNKAMVDPDIDIEYCIPEVASNGDACDVGAVPYILVKYAEDKYVQRKIRLTDTYMKNSVAEIANLVTFSIEQFKGEIDSVQMG